MCYIMKANDLNWKYFNADLNCFAYYIYYRRGCILILKLIMRLECGFNMHSGFVFTRDTLTKNVQNLQLKISSTCLTVRFQYSLSWIQRPDWAVTRKHRNQDTSEVQACVEM